MDYYGLLNCLCRFGMNSYEFACMDAGLNAATYYLKMNFFVCAPHAALVGCNEYCFPWARLYLDLTCLSLKLFKLGLREHRETMIVRNNSVKHIFKHFNTISGAEKRQAPIYRHSSGAYMVFALSAPRSTRSPLRI